MKSNNNKSEVGQGLYFYQESYITEEIRSRILTYLTGLTKNVNDALDLTQECLIKLFIKKNDFEISKASYCTWALKIAHNLFIDNLRKRKHCIYISLIQEENDEGYVFYNYTPVDCDHPEKLFIMHETKEFLSEQMYKLPFREREVLISKYFDNEKTNETAIRTGIKENAVGEYMRRGKSALLKNMGYPESYFSK